MTRRFVSFRPVPYFIDAVLDASAAVREESNQYVPVQLTAGLWDYWTLTHICVVALRCLREEGSLEPDS